MKLENDPFECTEVGVGVVITGVLNFADASISLNMIDMELAGALSIVPIAPAIELETECELVDGPNKVASENPDANDTDATSASLVVASVVKVVGEAAAGELE